MVYRVRAAVVRVVCLLVSPLMARAAEEYEARIKKLEQEVEALRAEHRTNDVRVFWKEGLRFETSDKAFTAKLGGRIMADWTWVNEDDGIKADIGDQEDGVEFRRARLYTQGLMYGNVQPKHSDHVELCTFRQAGRWQGQYPGDALTGRFLDRNSECHGDLPAERSP